MQKMINYDDGTKENINKHNLWSQIPNLIKQQQDDDSGIDDNFFLYLKDANEAKYQHLIKNCENNDFKYLKDWNVFTEFSNNMQDVYKNIEEYNRSKKCYVLIIFDDMIADMISNKKLSPIVIKLFITGRKINISLASITQSYFAVPKNIRLNSTHYYEHFK